MTDVKDFLKTYWPSILTVIVTFLTLLTAFKILKVNFNPVVDKRIEKVVTIEAFESDNSIKSAEKENGNKLHDKHEICKSFDCETAATTSMCVCLDGKTSVGGSHTGPTFLTENGKDIDYKYYHHKGICHGECPK